MGEKLRAIRNSRLVKMPNGATKSMTQLEVATKAGISRMNYGRVEDGTTSCTLKTLDKIARALGVGMSEIFQ